MDAADRIVKAVTKVLSNYAGICICDEDAERELMDEVCNVARIGSEKCEAL